ncbi:hypothetical protein K431DRAFT_224870, partial [Polychaeton citri CBS 116435]
SPVQSQEQPKPRPKFSIINALFLHHDLLLHVASYMTIPTLIRLYSISKPFHFLFNSHYTTYIRATMSNLAPGSHKIFHWKMYRSLCIKDPTGRQDEVYRQYVLKSDNLAHIRQWRVNRDHIRDVPSLKWLQMVVWRHGVCKDILIQLATKGLRCPKGTLETLKRMWLVMDLPNNYLRIQAMRHEAFFSSNSLDLLTHFLIKIDMHFTNPLGRVFKQLPASQDPDANHMMRGAWSHGAFVGCEFRKLILSEQGLAALWRVLHDWSWDAQHHQIAFSRMDVLRLWIRHKYQIPDDIPTKEVGQPIMGIPSHEVGTGSLERRNVLTGCGLAEPLQRLLRPDELVIREAIRRQLSLQHQWVRMMSWGFCDDLGRNLPMKTAEELLRLSKKPIQAQRHQEAYVVKKPEISSGEVDVDPPEGWDNVARNAWTKASDEYNKPAPGPWSHNELYDNDDNDDNDRDNDDTDAAKDDKDGIGKSNKKPVVSLKDALKNAGISDEEVEDRLPSLLQQVP